MRARERKGERETKRDRERQGDRVRVCVGDFIVVGPCVEGTTCLLCMVFCVCAWDSESQREKVCVREKETQTESVRV